MSKKINPDEELAAQAQPIANIAFSGGGAKGAMYSGAYEALCASGQMDEWERVSGSSAGSLIATMVAFGVKPETLKEGLQEKSLLEFGERSRFIQNTNRVLTLLFRPPFRFALEWLGILEKTTIDIIPKTIFGKPLLNSNKPLGDFIDKLTTESVRDHCFSENSDSQKEFHAKLAKHLSNLDDNEADAVSNHLEKIKQKVTGQLIKEENRLTFNDLKLLRAIDPTKFKDLHITATKVEGGELKFFNSNTPDIPISLAARASSAFPGAYTRVNIDGELCSDGGILDNIPTKCFEINGKAQGRTLAMAFVDDESESAKNAIYHGGPNDANALIPKKTGLTVTLQDGFVQTFFAQGDKNLSQAENDTINNLRQNYALNTVILDSGNIHTLDLEKATEKFGELHDLGFEATLQYLLNHDMIERKFSVAKNIENASLNQIRNSLRDNMNVINDQNTSNAKSIPTNNFKSISSIKSN